MFLPEKYLGTKVSRKASSVVTQQLSGTKPLQYGSSTRLTQRGFFQQTLKEGQRQAHVHANLCFATVTLPTAGKPG